MDTGTENDLMMGGLLKEQGILACEITIGGRVGISDLFEEPLYSLELRDVTIRELLNAIAVKPGKTWSYDGRFVLWTDSAILERKPDGVRLIEPGGTREIERSAFERARSVYLRMKAAKEDSLKAKYRREILQILREAGEK